MRQNMYKQNYEAKGIQKYYSIHFVLDIYSRVLGLPRSMNSIFSETPLQKTSFPLKVNNNFIEILSQGQEPVQFTPSGLGLCLTRTCAGPLCPARISKFLYASVLLCLQHTVHLELLITSASYSCSTSFSAQIPGYEEDLMKTSHLGLSAPISH